MRIAAALVGDLQQHMADEVRSAERAVKTGIGAGADGLKAELRAQVTRSGLGDRLAKTWRSQVYPKGTPSVNAAAVVWTKAPKLVDAFDRGVLIKSVDGFFLAIPTAAAGTQRASGFTKRLTPGGWERRTGMRLRFVYRRGRPSLLVADGTRVNSRGAAVSNAGRRGGGTYTRLQNVATSVIFILLPQVRLKKRLDVEAAGERWQARVPGLILENWR